MTTFHKVLFLAMAAAGLAAAQSLDIYTNQSSDTNNLYATGVLQHSVSPGCNMCNVAWHTYAQAITIISPSGRQTSCNSSGSYAASQAATVQCEASLSIYNASGAPDLGNWSIEDQPYAYCSLAGSFFPTDFAIWLMDHLRAPTTYFTNCYPEGNYACYCTGIACTSGIPSCTGGWALNPSVCSKIIQATFLVFDVPNLGIELCTVSVASPALTPGPCT